MERDAQGHPVTMASEAATHAFDRVVDGLLRYRRDTGVRLHALHALDPDAPMTRVLAGCAAMLAHDRALLPRAAAALAGTEALRATSRELAHLAALRAWVEGRPEDAVAAWEAVIADHPRDALAIRLHHVAAFGLGARGRMQAAVEAAVPYWSADIPGWGAVLGCRCFANEECGDYAVAERAGRAAVALDPGDLWATHGVAHVLHMQGRSVEGLAWLAAGEPHWEGGNNLLHHLWWHRALVHLARGEVAEVLALYDRRFRDHASPLTQAQPDLYTDVQNAASMLWRLEVRGVPVGGRWVELADKAEARVGDTLSAFVQPHWMMALAAEGRDAAAQRLLEALAEGGGTAHGAVLREVALPACRAVLAHRRGRFAEAVAALRPVLGELHRLGGSHAQREVLEALFLDAAMRAGLLGGVTAARAHGHPMPHHPGGVRHGLATALAG